MHALGLGAKMREHWQSPLLCIALHLIQMDTTSLNHGGGDFRIRDAPEELKRLIDGVAGRWCGSRHVYAGDYTKNKEHEVYDDDGNEQYEDISYIVARAVFAVITCQMIAEGMTIGQTHHEKPDSAKAAKAMLLKYLETEVGCAIPHGSWEESPSAKPVLEAIDAIFPPSDDVEKKRKRKIENAENVEQKRRKEDETEPENLTYSFGERSVRDVCSDLENIGFKRDPGMQCSFGIFMITPKGRETGMLLSRDPPHSGGICVTTISMCKEEADLLKGLPGYQGLYKPEDEDAN